MTRRELPQGIVVDPKVCFGKPAIRGARIWAALIDENLAAGLAKEELQAAYPQLAAEDVRTALTYAPQGT